MLDFGDVLILWNTNCEVLDPVLLPDASLEFELFVEWIAGVLTSGLLTKGLLYLDYLDYLDSYFFVIRGFFIYVFLNKVVVDIALERIGFYFFLDYSLSVLFSLSALFI